MIDSSGRVGESFSPAAHNEEIRKDQRNRPNLDSYPFRLPILGCKKIINVSEVSYKSTIPERKVNPQLSFSENHVEQCKGSACVVHVITTDEFGEVKGTEFGKKSSCWEISEIILEISAKN